MRPRRCSIFFIGRSITVGNFLNAPDKFSIHTTSLRYHGTTATHQTSLIGSANAMPHFGGFWPQIGVAKLPRSANHSCSSA